MYNLNSIPEVMCECGSQESMSITSRRIKPQNLSRHLVMFLARMSLSVSFDEMRCVLEPSALSHVASVRALRFQANAF